MRLLILLLLCLALTPCVRAAEAAASEPPSVEFRLLGKSKPAKFVLGKTSQLRSGQRISIPGTEESIFAGTIVTLKPTLTETGEIAYAGTVEVIDFTGFEPATDGGLTAQTRAETVEIEGVMANHQATAVTLPEMGRTIYFAIDDPSRPKKDCAACGPRDKGELAKPSGS